MPISDLSKTIVLSTLSVAFPFIFLAQSLVPSDKYISFESMYQDRFGCHLESKDSFLFVGMWPIEFGSYYNQDSTRSQGGVYIFKRDHLDSLVFMQKLLPSNYGTQTYFNEEGEFGHNFSVSNEYLAIGANSEKVADTSGPGWTQRGTVYIFAQNAANVWNEVFKIRAPDYSWNEIQHDEFGISVGLDGNFLVVGAPEERKDTNNQNEIQEAGAAYVYERVGSNWNLVQKLIPSNRQSSVSRGFGFKVKIKDEMILVQAAGNASNNLANAYVFYRQSNGFWAETQVLTDSVLGLNLNRGGQYGFAEPIELTSDQVFIETRETEGANSISVVKVYDRQTSGQVTYSQTLKPSNNQSDGSFGQAIACKGDSLLIGAPRVDSIINQQDEIKDIGRAHLFVRNNGQWEVKSRLQHEDPDVKDYFGNSFAFTEEYMVVGAPFKDYHDTSQYFNDRGALYFFEGDTSTTVGLAQNTSNQEFGVNVFPNPATSMVSIQIEGDHDQYVINVMDLFGKVVIESTANSGKNTLPVQHLSDGLYFLHMRDESGSTQVSRFVVNNN